MREIRITPPAFLPPYVSYSVPGLVSAGQVKFELAKTAEWLERGGADDLIRPSVKELVTSCRS